MRTLSLFLFALIISSVSAQTPENVRLVTDHDLSPDGNMIVFSWRGDIWSVSSQGGDVTRLTFHDATDSSPLVSPDGKTIAFVSNRNDGNQIFTMPIGGGIASQVTLHTEGYAPLMYAANGDAILSVVRRDHSWTEPQRLILQPMDGRKAPELLFDGYGEDASISADGRYVLFCREGAPTYRKHYKGAQASQVWLFDREDKSFKKLHGEDMGARSPRFIGDTHEYVYCSQASGTWDLYRCKLGSHEKKQLTRFDGDGAMFPAVSRDGRVVVYRQLFNLRRHDLETGNDQELKIQYAGDATLPRVQRMSITSCGRAAWTDDGLEVAFIAADDLWIMDTELKEPVRVTDSIAAERDPVWAADMKSVYFVSDQGGYPDIWMAKGKDADLPLWQNTEFELAQITDDEDSEARLQLWKEGTALAFHQNTNVVSMDLESKKVDVLIETWSSPSYKFSPDEKWIAYSTQDENYNSDIWIKPTDGSREPYNLSCHPDNDWDPVWSADGKFIAFSGRRWGTETDIMWAHLSKEENEKTARQKRLEKAIEKMKKRKSKKDDPKSKGKAEAKKEDKPGGSDPISGIWKGKATGPAPIPPSGLDMTFELTMDASGNITGTATTILGVAQIESGTHDPKTGELVLNGAIEGDDFTVEGTIKDGKGKGTWTGIGGNGAWEMERTEARSGSGEGKKSSDDKKGKDDKKVEVKIDFDGLRDRLRRIRISNSSERSLVFGPKGSKLYFSATVAGKRGTYSVNLPEKLGPVAVKGNIPSSGRWLKSGKLGTTSGGKPALVTDSGSTTSYSFTATAERELGKFHQAMFDQAWRIMRDRFYDPAMGGNDWNAIREKYQQVAAECLNDGSINQVVSMMLGELNASHLGFHYGSRGRTAQSPPWRESTYHLGARFDESHDGPGLLIKDVVSQTPATREVSLLNPGDVILSVDDKEASPDVNLAVYFTARAGHRFKLRVRNTEGEERDVTILPTRYGRVRSRLYEDWIDDCQAQVDKLSGGTLGYVHIRGMGSTNLIRFDEELFRVGYGKDGLIIDVRQNGGGSITDHLLTCLMQPTHALTKTREGGIGYPQDRRVYASWDKPIIVLCNQNSFSNAEIFSHAIKTLERGKVVGVPTAGGVISTGGTSLLGGAFMRLPGRGWYVLGSGEDMELNGCVPDVVIWPEPTEMPAGKDRQLEKAVELLSADAKAFKNRPKPKLRKASER